MTDNFQTAINAAQTAEEFVLLVEIDHPNLASPILVNDSGAPITSNGVTYLPTPFDFIFPDDVDGQSPQCTLTIDNIDRSITAAVKSMGSYATTVITLVMASDPNTIEAQYTDFILADFTGDVHQIQGTLTVEDFTTQYYPQHQFTPGNFSGLF